MKTIITTIAIAAAALFVSVNTAEAGPHYGNGYGNSYGNSHGHGGYSHSQKSYGHSYGHGHHCQPYKVSTCEVNRYRQCRTKYDHCGHPITYHVTVVTYRDHYSDGSTRTYTKVYS